jgi:hypothetical protein
MIWTFQGGGFILSREIEQGCGLLMWAQIIVDCGAEHLSLWAATPTYNLKKVQ